MTPLSKQEVPIVKGSRKAVEFDPEKHRKITDKKKKPLKLRRLARN
jgi:hypothetical protein